jgi:hypothetical protein
MNSTLTHSLLVLAATHVRRRCLLQLRGIYVGSHQLHTLVAAITQKVLVAANIWAVRLGAFRFRFPTILVDLPCTFFSVQTKLLPAASIVARHLVFSQRISSLAGLVIAHMARQRWAIERGRGATCWQCVQWDSSLDGGRCS